MQQTDIKYVAVHCSATKPDQDIGVKEIDAMHKAKGWAGAGYQFVIPRNGALEIGRSLTEVGAHVFGFNRVSWGVCLIGGLDHEGNYSNEYSGAQLRTLRQLLTTLLLMAPGAEIKGHRDFSPDINGDGVIDKFEFIKACPCFDVATWWLTGEVN